MQYKRKGRDCNMNIGIICPSEIAFRRFMPALEKLPGLHFAGIGVGSKEEWFGEQLPAEETIEKILGEQRKKAQEFITQYGGRIYDSYEKLVTAEQIDAVYIPLPPALHYQWAKKALETGKHVLVEKPSTIAAKDTAELAALAEGKGLALHENYMFAFHEQLEAIRETVASGELGEVRLYRVSFGFPRRAANDFRYNKKLGGGALIDAGGYTLKYASMLLGEDARVRYAQMNGLEDFEVDIYGSGALTNSEGVTVQIAYGMDNNYKCELEVWGSKGCLYTGRVLTAPAGFVPEMVIRKGNEEEVRKLPADDAFGKSLHRFMECVQNPEIRQKNYKELVRQAELVDEFRRQAAEQQD